MPFFSIPAMAWTVLQRRHSLLEHFSISNREAAWAAVSDNYGLFDNTIRTLQPDIGERERRSAA
jgi:hypothetical protein